MNNVMRDSFNKGKKVLNSKTAKVLGAGAIALTLNMGKANAQTLMNKKDVKKVYELAKESQENIGEDMAKFLFSGEIEKWLQDEIVKQNNENLKDKRDISLFKNETVKELNTPSDSILSKEEMTEILKRKIDSMVTLDVAEYYKAFEEFQASNVNIAGDQEKGGLEAGWNLLPFETMIDIDYLMNSKDLPYTKKERKEIKEKIESIFAKHLTDWKTKALTYRQSMSAAEYKTACLIALEIARNAIVEELYATYGKSTVDKVFKQFYATQGTYYRDGKTISTKQNKGKTYQRRSEGESKYSTASFII